MARIIVKEKETGNIVFNKLCERYIGIERKLFYLKIFYEKNTRLYCASFFSYKEPLSVEVLYDNIEEE